MTATDDIFDAADSLSGESRHGGEESSDEVEWLAPDEMLERQRARFSFRRKPDAGPPAARRKRGEPFMPSTDWVRAFRAQMTSEARDKVRAYARYRVEMLKSARLPCDDAAVDEWVHAAIADTLDGRIRWKHEVVSLVNHLKDTIRSRTWKELERARKFRHVSLDHGADDPHDENEYEEKPTEVEASLAGRKGGRERDELAGADLRRKVLAGMRERAGESPELLALLDAFELGITERVDVCAHTGLSEDQYHNARRRLMRHAMKLHEDLRASAMEAMSRDAE